MTATRRPLRLTYIGGPTALIEVAGLRLLTDPTFDAAGAEFRSGAYVLQRTEDPAIDAAQIGHPGSHSTSPRWREGRYGSRRRRRDMARPT